MTILRPILRPVVSPILRGVTDSPTNARRNLLTYSEQFDNAAWLKSNVTVTANAVASPFGAMTADTITGVGAASAFKGIRQIFGAAAGPLTESVYLKAGTHSIVQLLWDESATPYANFDLTNGVVGSSSGAATITAIGDGWYRCSHVFTPASTSGAYIALVDSTSAARGASSTSVGTVHAWGAQVERGTTASAYQRHP